jgi:integrase/recombinase XerD
MSNALPASAGIDRRKYADVFVSRWKVENTRIAYRMDLEIFFRWCEDNKLDPFEAHRMHLDLFVDYLADERDNSPSTIHHRIGTIRQFYEIAMDDDYVRKNPCRLLKLPTRHIDETRSKSLTPREHERLAWAAAEYSPTAYALVLSMGVCGLRVSEACSLDVETATVVDQAHRVFKFQQKGGAFALVPQPPIVIQAVDRVIEGRTTGPLFLRRDRTRMTRTSADKLLKKIASKAGIESRVSPHVLRHTFCETALAANVPLETVARSMRHKDSSTTYRHYGRRSIPANQHSSFVVAGQLQVPTLS